MLDLSKGNVRGMMVIGGWGVGRGREVMGFNKFKIPHDKMKKSFCFGRVMGSQFSVIGNVSWASNACYMEIKL